MPQSDSTPEQVLGAVETYTIPTYRRLPIVFERGEGCWLFDDSGRPYLDLVAGIATNQLGHSHPAMVEVITEQAAKLLHVPGSCVTRPLARLAQDLCTAAGMDRVFFTPCGTTAVETALKIAKKWGRHMGDPDRTEVVALAGSFHGRTLGSLSATMQDKFQAPFRPLLPGFHAIPRNDVEALRAAIGPRTAAVIMEPIQGESGVHPMTAEFISAARTLSSANGSLLIFDEIQTGMGRTGSLFRFQELGVHPDILVLAKGLGSGIPIGACLARGPAAEVLGPGDHGSTSGGNPLACAVASRVLEIVAEPGFLAEVRKVGESLVQQARTLPASKEVRGAGLMVGIEFDRPVARRIAERGLEEGLLLNAASDNVIRLVPPLILEAGLAQEAMIRLTGVVQSILAEAEL